MSKGGRGKGSFLKNQAEIWISHPQGTVYFNSYEK